MLLVRAVLLALVLALAAASPSAAQDQQPVPTPTPTPAPEEPRIAPGVFAAGVDLSNLTIPEATAKLQQTLATPLAQPLVVAVAGKRYVLKVKRTRFAFDAERTAKRAYYAGQNNPPSQPEGGGTAAQLDVGLAVSFRRAVVRDFALSINRKVYLAPRNATVRITVRRMLRRKSRAGRDLKEKALRATLEQALADPRIPRLVKPGRRKVRAKIRFKHLPRIYRTVVTIDQANFKLRLFKRLKLVKVYGVATGTPDYPTPRGRFSIQTKQVNPTWTAPNSPWAGEMAGQSVSGGAWNNPLKARWMGITGSVGIHGTGQEWSIGSRASHGCLRMRVADVIALYRRVPLGTPVLIR